MTPFSFLYYYYYLFIFWWVLFQLNVYSTLFPYLECPRRHVLAARRSGGSEPKLAPTNQTAIYETQLLLGHIVQYWYSDTFIRELLPESMASSGVFLPCFALISLLFACSDAADYVVGGTEDAWKIPSSPGFPLTDWAKKQRFQIGDSLSNFITLTFVFFFFFFPVWIFFSLSRFFPFPSLLISVPSGAFLLFNSLLLWFSIGFWLGVVLFRFYLFFSLHFLSVLAFLLLFHFLALSLSSNPDTPSFSDLQSSNMTAKSIQCWN